jgi:uncharacterized protein YceH (UPF0502 family)
MPDRVALANPKPTWHSPVAVLAPSEVASTFLRGDKTDDLRTIAQLRFDHEVLQRRVEELESEVAELRTRLRD